MKAEKGAHYPRSMIFPSCTSLPLLYEDHRLKVFRVMASNGKEKTRPSGDSGDLENMEPSKGATAPQLHPPVAL